jgi:hypothetical protein
MGPATGPVAVNALCGLLRDGDGSFARAAAESLGRLEETAATKSILDELAKKIRGETADGNWLEDTCFNVLSQLVQYYRPDAESTDTPAESSSPQS